VTIPLFHSNKPFLRTGANMQPCLVQWCISLP
jgi:hypothetical protein